MKNHGGKASTFADIFRRNAARIAGLAIAFGLVGLPALGLAQDAPTSVATAYRDLPQLGGSRNLIWVIAQLHLLLAGFVLGVPIFAWLCEVVGWKTGEKRYDKLAKEFTKLLTSSYATTALFGGILLFMLIGFYPKLMAYLSDIFFPSFVVYCGLFLVETATLYLYWYGWDVMQGNKKPLHLFPRVSPECFRIFYHDRAELLGDLPSESCRNCGRHRFGPRLGGDLESNVVAGEYSPIDCQRRARRIHLWGLCRHSILVRHDAGRTRPLRLDGLCRQFYRRLRSACRCPSPAIGSCVKFISTISKWASHSWADSCPGCSFSRRCSSACFSWDRIIISGWASPIAFLDPRSNIESRS